MRQSAALSSIFKSDPAHSSKKVFVAGVGAVGGTLLKQINALNNAFKIQIIGICNTKFQKFYPGTEAVTASDLYQKSAPKNWVSILEELIKNKSGCTVFVDATGSDEVAALYFEILKNGIHIVTPSKIANSQSNNQFKELHQTAENKGVTFNYETNVGAGLPVIHTLKSLIATGDEIIEISGILSGTMTYIFSELDKGKSFSEAVINARSLGYAEPDPRDDLSGEDVARKFLILARICGIDIERDELEVESLIPDILKDVDATTFLEKLPVFDHEWKQRIESENKLGNKIRYTGRLAGGKIRIKTESVKDSSPLGRLTGTNNLIEIKTRRYFDQPLIIQGPGAGKEVTAAGVLNDILGITYR